jgi:hypothetical protein
MAVKITNKNYRKDEKGGRERRKRGKGRLQHLG